MKITLWFVNRLTDLEKPFEAIMAAFDLAIDWLLIFGVFCLLIITTPIWGIMLLYKMYNKKKGS